MGTKNLNKKMQQILNPKSQFKKEKQFGDIIFREGDKIMQVKNNYDIYWESVDGKSYGSGVYNGDLGIISNVNDEAIEVIFDDEKVVKYENSVLEEIEHAYAVTIHKSQGSEFKVVVMIITSGSPMLYTRNLLYTGVTRAKEFLIIIGNEQVLARMIENADTKKRNTGLKFKIEKFADIFNM